MADFDVFLAGVIQGSHRGTGLSDQHYRKQVKEILGAGCAGIEIYDPVERHPSSVTYSTDQARKTFLEHLDIIGRSRCLVAYLPEASMGTGIEMWYAYRRSIPVISISSMEKNWVVRILSSVVCRDLKEFGEWSSNGGLREFLSTE